MWRSLLVQFIASTLLWACTSPDPSEVAHLARAPLTGKADAKGGHDQADRSCRVLLRSVHREVVAPDATTVCGEGACAWVWRGIVELAEGVVGTPSVLYHRVGDPQWWQVDATPGVDASAWNPRPGLRPFTFTLRDHVPQPVPGQAGDAAPAVEIIAFVSTPDGTRLFDHNRGAGSFDNIVLDAKSFFSLRDDGSCSPEVGHLSFTRSWDEHVTGMLRQGGYLVINYDLDRLPTCRGTHNGYPAWDIVAHITFEPGGQGVEGSVRELENSNGRPLNKAHTKDLVVKIPSDATGATIWFRNYSGAGNSCEAWDSNYGANYHYSVYPEASDPHCKDIEQWGLVASDMPYEVNPYCLAYDVAMQRDADHCEFFVSGLGDGEMGHYGLPVHWVEAYLTVGKTPGELLGVGMLTRYKDPASGALSSRWTMARSLGGDTWQTGFIRQKAAIMGSMGFDYRIAEMAFFIDVRRPSGEVLRLWQSRHGANYSWDDAFGAGTTVKPIPYGGIGYAVDGAGIFDAKRVCKK